MKKKAAWHGRIYISNYEGKRWGSLKHLFNFIHSPVADLSLVKNSTVSGILVCPLLSKMRETVGSLSGAMKNGLLKPINTTAWREKVGGVNTIFGYVGESHSQTHTNMESHSQTLTKHGESHSQTLTKRGESFSKRYIATAYHRHR